MEGGELMEKLLVKDAGKVMRKRTEMTILVIKRHLKCF